jgi:hypothetical protein
MFRLTAVAILVAASGCTRPFYRKQADCESIALVQYYENDPRWQLIDYRIYPDPRSRFFSPFDADFPPMPPDDPAAHRMMHCVDCKQGYPCWHAHGDTPEVESPYWQNYLPLDGEGKLPIDLPLAVELGYVNSRNYQTQLEDLYLSALDVTFERFRFDVQFFGRTQETSFTAQGPVRAGRAAGSSVLATATTPQVSRLFASGGQLVTEVANNIVWQFAGTDSSFNTTIADFTFVQPLLRGAGRYRVLERLTLAERLLLYNVRAMYRYQQGFYVEIYTGRSAGQGPDRRGGLFGGAGLQGFTGIGSGGFGAVGAVTAPGAGGGGGFTGGAGAAQANGYLGLLQDAMNIQNRQANVNGLRSSLAQLEAAYDAGRIDRFQVDLARQALFNAQSQLLTARAAFQTTLDAFKLTLGLPPHLELVLNDPMLERFELLQPALLELQEDIGRLLDDLRSPDKPADAPLAASELEQALEIRRAAEERLGVVEDDFQRLDEAMPRRIEQLKSVRERSIEARVEVGPIAYSEEAFRERVAEAKRDYAELDRNFEQFSTQLLEFAEQETPTVAARKELIELMTTLSALMEQMLLVQARARLDAVTLTPIEIDAVEALKIAAEHRLDWMNARAALVDQWRLIQFNANDLMAGLNLVVSGDIGTVGNNPVKFQATNSQLRVGLQFDAPVTRIAERNIYRQSIIEYLQARRSYMNFVDSINLTLRNEVRIAQLDEINFELRRAAVLIAINQVDITSLRLRQPPAPGEQGTLGVTAARDLVDSLGNLLNVQNDFLSVWVNYEVQRVSLDFDMGTMLLDDKGLWIDPGPIRPGPRAGIDGNPICPVPDPVLAEGLQQIEGMLAEREQEWLAKREQQAAALEGEEGRDLFTPPVQARAPQRGTSRR